MLMEIGELSSKKLKKKMWYTLLLLVHIVSYILNKYIPTSSHPSRIKTKNRVLCEVPYFNIYFLIIYKYTSFRCLILKIIRIIILPLLSTSKIAL